MNNNQTRASNGFQAIRDQLDLGFTSLRQGGIVLICFLLYVADGYDVLSISMAGPHIASEWGIKPEILGFVLSAELIGMTVGSLVLSGASDKYGRRWVLIGSVGLISASMVLTALCTSIWQLLVLRLSTGFGIGGVIGAGAAMASEFSPEKRRNQVVISLTCGFSLGAIVVGPVANMLLESSGWQSIFLVGGIAGFVLLGFMVLIMPESIEFIARKSPKNEHEAKQQLDELNQILTSLSLKRLDSFEAEKETQAQQAGVGMKGLLSADYRLHTLRLWAIFFLLYWVIYLIIKWTPALFIGMGFSSSHAIYALTIGTIGGVLGNITLGALVTKFQIERLVTIMLVIGGFIMAGFSLFEPNTIASLYTILFFMNYFISGGFAGLYAIATNSYPTHLRASGLGFSVGIGRIGAILSPIATGFLVGANWNIFTIYLILAVPVVMVSALLVAAKIQK